MKKIPIRQISSVHNELPSSERFKIRKVEELLDREDLFHELHRHDFFFIIALQKGDGTHEIDFTTYSVFDNSVFFMRPGQVITAVLVKADEAVIDGAVRGVGKMALGSGSSLRRIQNGFVRSYAALILIGAVILIAAIWVVVQ